MQNSGPIEIPSPTYGYPGASQLSHEWVDIWLYNDWAHQDLDGLIYVGRLGGNMSDKESICQVWGCACHYRMKYTRGVIATGEEWAKLAEWQIDKLSVRKEVLGKQLEEADIPDGLGVEIKGELGSIDKRWGSSRGEGAKQEKRPLLTPLGWADIELGAQEGTPPVRWEVRMSKSGAAQRERSGEFGTLSPAKTGAE